MTVEPHLADPLASIDTWGADHAAAAVLDRSGLLASHGDLDRVFRIASVTKLATAYAVLIAVEEGTVALDDPVGPPGATVLHLLCHAGGYDFDSGRVLAPPATRRIYSNTGYERLADHLADRAGMPFEQYLREAVLAPLGMASSGLDGSPAKDLRSSVHDLCRFAAEWSTPTLIDHTTWQRAIHAQFPDLAGVLPGWGRQDPCPWGLGPELRGTKHPHWTGATAANTTFGHFGGSGTFVWIDPGRGLACIVLTDRVFGDWAVERWPGFSDLVRSRFS